ncbi:sporulation protein YunB [Filibacter tadaridae]|uniref:Sporulation protein YunB n=1 Tax=Filibacter tadaridae TaxID=2483811 RepID=A0A3P5XNN3_9BACL|nr:sporulation protein YunB [Filibacter tadaridae]VDC31963.1 Sporulation protein YunB [Filibacter tadaridae]
MPFLIPAIILAIVLFFIFINARLTPTYVRYAEVQTKKIASHVINQAISSRTANVLEVNDVIENIPSEGGTVTTKFNTDVINRVMSETHKLVEMHLKQVEAGNIELLPKEDNIEFDPQAMEDQGGVVFFVSLGQATNIPLLGNLGPKIPIRFHVIGEVHSTIEPTITEFGINSAYVEINVLLTVNVQIIVPLATKKSSITQKILVASGLTQGVVPDIYTNGGEGPSFEVPMKSGGGQ